MEELEYELSMRGISKAGEDHFGMVERLRRDLGLVVAWEPEGEIDKFREILGELENIC